MSDVWQALSGTASESLEMLEEAGGVHLLNELSGAFSDFIKGRAATKQHFRVREVACFVVVKLREQLDSHKHGQLHAKLSAALLRRRAMEPMAPVRAALGDSAT